MGGELGVRWAKPPSLGHGVQGGSGGADPPGFTSAWCTRGVRGLALVW